MPAGAAICLRPLARRARDGVIAAARDGLLVARLGLLEEAAAQRDVVDPHGSLWLVGGKEEVWDVLLELHGVREVGSLVGSFVLVVFMVKME